MSLGDSLKELLQVAIGILNAGIAGSRQVLGTAAEAPSGDAAFCCHPPAMPTCGCCDAACCGAYPPYTGPCHAHSSHSCTSGVRTG